MADRMDISNSDIKASILRAAKHSFLDGNEKEELIKEIEMRLNKHFQIYKPKHYHNDSIRVININENDSNISLNNFDNSDVNKIESENKTPQLLKYFTFAMMAAGLSSIIISKSRKRSDWCILNDIICLYFDLVQVCVIITEN